ncbi:hypothetical protein [Billgrantia bachuensis]|uniref:Apea-like HEPN domain-containing protein n=1 Tax=Billgrantia bachuensis TaxID=2717286 RepID=A0ABX0PTV1_9GAMM|nr:hypothetical protein [Halomonas bachuensis]NIC05638.1 hypothetical protein [Halomonas bachuensis]
MPIKWKARSGLNPQAILDKIESAKSVSADGRVSYSAFDYHENFASIFSLLDIPTVISSELDVDALVSKGLGRAAKAGVLTKESVIRCLNDAANDELATSERRYHLLTSLSMDDSLPFRRLSYRAVQVRVVGDKYPKKYGSRREAIKFGSKGFSLEHKGYTKLIVSTKAKSVHGAASKALNGLDVIRALLSLFSNSSMELMGDKYAPINKIRTGQVHTLHSDTGGPATEIFWFEPNFVQGKPYRHKAPEVLRKNFSWSMGRLTSSSYRGAIEEALLRYVRALDEKDHNSAAIRLWGALESLASPGEARYDNIVKRCSFLFAEDDYHRQILEHLREFRNRSIHSGDQSEKAKTFCYQMQFYLRQLVLFHFHRVSDFASLDEANSFLDMPADGAVLRRQRRLIDRAMKFKNVED